MPFQAENGSRPRFHLLDNAEIGTETYGRFTVYERAHAVHILQRVAMGVLDEKSRGHETQATRDIENARLERPEVS